MGGELLIEYGRTRYLVLADDASVVVAEVRVGEPAPEVDALLTSFGATSGVFVTAWNPRSEPTAAQDNAVAHGLLAAEVRAAGLVALPHHGVGADPAWTEQGLFVIGLAEPAATALAEAYEQNAVVVVDLGRSARLVTTRLMT